MSSGEFNAGHVDAGLNIYFSILLVVHVAVLIGIVYVQKPWTVCCVGNAYNAAQRANGSSSYHSETRSRDSAF